MVGLHTINMIVTDNKESKRISSKMRMENNLKKVSMSQFEWYDRGEHDYQWLIKHHKKLANRYERHKEKLRLNKWRRG